MTERIIDSSRELRSIVTRKSMLPRLANRDGPAWESSWQYLFMLYQPAMERYVARVLSRTLRKPSDPQEVQDLVQTWFMDCIGKGWLERDAESIRCFRAYLQTQLRRMVYKHLEKRFAKKRHGGPMASAEALEGVAGEATAVLDDGLVRVAVEEALRRLRSGNEDYADVIEDLLRTEGEGSHDLAERMGKSNQQVVHLRHRARKRFSVLFHEALRETVRDEDDFEALLKDLAPYLP